MEYERLKKQSEFQKLFAKGKRAFSPSFTLVYLPQREGLKMGVSVGKRHGKSVQRNKIKRLIREAFRAEREKIEGSYMLVIVPKVKEEYSVKEFQKHLQWLIKKEKL